MKRYEFALAHPDDDAQLRERMAQDWIEGAAAISLRREPSYFAACRLQGERAQVIVGRDITTGQILAAGSRSIAITFVDGQPKPTAYLSDLRIHRDHRNGMLLARVYRFLRTLHEADPAPCYTLVYEDNEKALGSLTGGRAGLPYYLPRARLFARAVRLGRPRPALTVSGATIRRADASELPAVVAFLNRHNAAYRWAPVLTVEDFMPGGRCDTLRAEDFFIVKRCGEIRAVMAAWDQATLRQAHVERYMRPMALLRRPYNVFASLRGLPQLPPAGEPLRYVYLAFIAVEDNDPALCAALLRHVYNALCNGRWLYALATLPDDDPLLPVFSEYAGSRSAVRLFEVDFEATAETIAHASTPRSQAARIEFALC